MALRGADIRLQLQYHKNRAYHNVRGTPVMRDFNVFVDDMAGEGRPGEPYFQIAVAPFTLNGGSSMGTKQYFSRDHLARDLQTRLRYTPAAVERFFASDDRHHILTKFPLSETDAAYLGW